MANRIYSWQKNPQVVTEKNRGYNHEFAIILFRKSFHELKYE